MPTSTDNFDFSCVGDERAKLPFLGYVSAIDKTTCSELAMVRGSKNVYKKLSGTITAREGLKRQDDADATIAGVDSSYEWENSLGLTRVLRVSNSKLQVEVGTTWYNLITGLSLSRFVFDAWWNNSLKKDQLLFVKGDNNIHMWDGGVGVILSTTANTIVLTDDAVLNGFATSGTVYINGNSYTYSGITNETLTGVSANPTGEANGSIVILAPITTASKPVSGFICDFIKVIGNQVYVGSYTSRQVFVSDTTDYTDYTVPATRAPGDPYIYTLDSNCKGIGVRLGEAYIFGGTSDLYLLHWKQTTVGDTIPILSEIGTGEKKVLASLDACLAHEFIDNVGDDLIWLTQGHQLKTFGTYRNLLQPVFPTLSKQIKTELEETDFTGGHLRAINESIYITSPITGNTYWLQQRVSVTPEGNITTERLWQPPQVWGGSRIALINGVEYIHSSSNPQLYQMFNTGQWHDDSPSDEELPYEAFMIMAYRGVMNSKGYVNRAQLLSFDKTFFEGYMTQGSKLYGQILYDYQGVTSTLNIDINTIVSPARFTGYGTSGISLGDAPLGDNPLGDGLNTAVNDQDTIPKFKKIKTLPLTNCFEYQMIVGSTDAGSRWEILCLGTNAQPCEEKANFLQN